jgi:hypothetical protein
MPLGALVLRTLPETLFAVLKLESALLTFVFMFGSLAIGHFSEGEINVLLDRTFTAISSKTQSVWHRASCLQ